MNLDDFSYEENGRRYINPQVALDEENAFIQNLRNTQAQDNAKIYQDTHNLGTDVSSNLGGLNGGEAYFNARYQTPQTNYTIANLREAAQAKALSDALNNEVAKAKKRYNDAYKAANSGGGSGGGNNGGGDGNDNANDPNHENPSDPSKTNPNGIDTVSEHAEKQDAKNMNNTINNLNTIGQATGGGALPKNPTGTVYYLHAPDGSKSWVMINKSLYGNGVSTPTGDYEKQSGVNYINNKLKQGYKLYTQGGKAIDNSLWRLVTGIDN